MINSPDTLIVGCYYFMNVLRLSVAVIELAP